MCLNKKQSAEITEKKQAQKLPCLTQNLKFQGTIRSGCLGNSSCFLTTRRSQTQNHQTTKQLPNPQRSPHLSVSAPRSSEWANGTFYCVILPLRKNGREGVVWETKPTLCFEVFLLFLKVRQHQHHHRLLLFLSSHFRIFFPF